MRPGEPVIDGMACAVNLAHEVVREIPVGMGPEGIAVDAAGRRAFVACPTRPGSVIIRNCAGCTAAIPRRARSP